MNKPTPEQALELVTQGLAMVPTNKWSDRVTFVIAVDVLIAALQERQQLLDAQSTAKPSPAATPSTAK